MDEQLPIAPFGEAGAASAEPVCRCGATALNASGGRCAHGHVLTANRDAMIVGERSGQFWREAAAARAEIREAAISDAGFTSADAPRTLSLAADGLAQAALLRDAAFTRVVESGGPLTASDRGRRAFAVWEAASAAVERHVRALGLKRAPRPVASFADAVRAVTAGEAAE